MATGWDMMSSQKEEAPESELGDGVSRGLEEERGKTHLALMDSKPIA